MASKKLINLSNLQKFLLKLNEKFALKKAMKGISEDAEGNIIIGEEGLVPTPNENSKGKFLRSDGEWALPSETAVYDSMTIEEGIAGVSEVDKVLNAKNLKQIVNSDGFLTSLDSSKLTGIINIENLPQGALERILIVSSKEERLTLSDTEVQLGDVVKEADTGLMYYVINTEKLNSEEGYTQFTAGSATSVPWSGVTDKPSIPTKTSDLTNDSNFAIDSNVVHKTGNETINGTKTFSDKIISNKELHYKDTLYDWSDTSINTWCDAGHVAWYDKTGNRRMHELVGANGGVWRKVCYINENSYFEVDSNMNIIYYGISFKFNGKNVALDENLVHTSGNETIAGNKTFSNKIKGNLQGNADTATKASYLDSYSLPGGNRIYLDWDTQVKSYVGLKVDNTVMGGLITTKNIGSQSVKYATTAGSANSVAWANVTGKPNLASTTFVKGTNYWYRKHSDGFIEMGGFTNWVEGGSVLATNLPIAFSNTNYTLLVQLGRGGVSNLVSQTTNSKSTTRFEVHINNLGAGTPDSTTGGYDWYACGY